MKKVYAVLIAIVIGVGMSTMALAQQSYPFNGYPDWVYADRSTPSYGYMRSTSKYQITSGRNFWVTVSSKNRAYKYSINTATLNYLTGDALTASGSGKTTISVSKMGSALTSGHDTHCVSPINNSAQNGLFMIRRLEIIPGGYG